MKLERTNDMYRDLIDRVNLRSIRLRSLVAKNGIREESSQLQINVKESYTAKPMDDELIAVARIRIWSSEKDEHDKPLVYLDCSFDLDYGLISGAEFPKKIYILFAQRNVAINVWPYFREVISTTTSRFGLPPLVLPVKRVRF